MDEELLVARAKRGDAAAERQLYDNHVDRIYRLAYRMTGEDDQVVWVSHDVTLTSQPAASLLQRIEDWFFAHLPIEDEL